MTAISDNTVTDPQQIAELERKLDELTAQQAATVDILKVIAGSPGDAQPVFEAVADRAMKLLDCWSVIVTRFDGECFQFGAARGALPDTEQFVRQRYQSLRPDRASLLGRCLRERIVVSSADALAEPDPQLRDYARKRGLRAILIVPLLRDDKVEGALILTRAEPGLFAPREIELVQTFADQAAIAIENARLFGEVQARTRDLTESLEQQTATSEVLEIISASTGELEPVFQKMLENATRVCGANFGVLSLYEGDSFRNVAFCNVPSAFGDSPQTFRPHPESAMGTLVRTRQAVQFEDVRAHAPYLEGHPTAIAMVDLAGARTLVAVPMLRENELVGAIAIYRQEVRPFSGKQVELVANFAKQAVIAIENTRLLNELRKRTDDLGESLQQQTATADVLKVISRSAFDLNMATTAILQAAAQLCRASLATLHLRDGDVCRLVTQFGLPEAFEQISRDNPIPARYPLHSHRQVRAGEFAQFTDAWSDSDYLYKAVAKLGGYRAIIVIPMMREDDLVGIFSLARPEPEPFTPDQIKLVQTFADQAAIAIENARLFNELRRRTDDLGESLQQQTATADVLKVISRSAFDLKSVLTTLIESAKSLCGASLGIITLRDGEVMRLRAESGCTQAFLDFMHANPIRPGRATFTGRVFLDGKPVHVADVEQDAEYNFGRAPTIGAYRAVLAVPLMRDGAVEGVLLLGRPEPGPFTQRQVELVQTFADQAVIAIENARLFNETKEALERQTATASILKVIASSPSDVQPVFEAIVRSANTLVGGFSSTVFRFIDGIGHLKAFTPTTPAADQVLQASFPLPVSDFLPFQMAQAGEATQIADTETLTNEILNIARARGFRSILFAPMMSDGVSIGSIAVTRVETGAFADHHVQLLQTFADQAVIAIQNVKLFEEVQARTREVEESLQQQTATAEVLKVISRSAFDLQAVFDTLISSAVELSGAFNGTICLREGDGYRYLATAGLQSDFSKFLLEHPPTPGRGSAAGRVLLSGNVESIPDVLEDAEYIVPAYDLNKTRSVLGVPLLRIDGVEGALVLARTEPGQFTGRQVDLVQSFADQAVIAIDNVRLFEQVQARTRELSSSLEELRTAQDRLVQTEKLASLGQLTAGIAHEIKNPLNFVNNFSALSTELIDELKDVLKPAALDDKTREEIDELTQMLKGNLEKVVQHGKRADSIVKNMLLHSREGSGEQRSADINAIVEESLNLAYHGARAEKPGFNIALRRDLDPAAGMIDLYPQEMTRVFLNLISNGFYAAAKRKEASDEGFEPTLSATTKSLGNKVEIRIRDNGTGIPPEVRERMFNPFFTTKPAGEGTGLGLSMSHDIVVKQHGGKIEVDTMPGAFTEFIITLPRVAAAQQQAGGTH
jgi:two-component system NtrC family sensor kinase